jgi:hypothetical protein
MMMAFEPKLSSSLAQLAESASANGILCASSDLMSAPANKAKEQEHRYYIRMLHKAVDEANIMLIVLDTHVAQLGCRS